MTALAEPRRVVTLTMLAVDVEVGKGLFIHSSHTWPGASRLGQLKS